MWWRMAEPITLQITEERVTARCFQRQHISFVSLMRWEREARKGRKLTSCCAAEEDTHGCDNESLIFWNCCVTGDVDEEMMKVVTSI